MNKKVIIGLVFVVVAVILIVVSSLQNNGSSTTIPQPSYNNPNDPAIKGLSLN